MTYSEKIATEDRNTTEIYLYKEGAFWKAYERSALLFSENIERYKPSKKFVKTQGKEIISIGFPDSGLDLIGKKYKIQIEDREARIQLDQVKPLAEDALEEWKARTPVKEKTPPMREEYHEEPPMTPVLSVLECIERFQLEIATPIECMMFLSDIKRQLKNDCGALRQSSGI